MRQAVKIAGVIGISVLLGGCASTVSLQSPESAISQEAYAAQETEAERGTQAVQGTNTEKETQAEESGESFADESTISQETHAAQETEAGRETQAVQGTDTAKETQAGESGKSFADKGENVQYFCGFFNSTMYQGSRILTPALYVADLEEAGVGEEVSPSQISNAVNTYGISILCQIPGCLHTAADKNCLYNIYNSIERSFVSGNTAAFFRHNSENGDYELYVMGTDGENIKKIKEWQGVTLYANMQAVLVDKKLYFFVMADTQSVDENGYLMTEKEVGELYCLDMEERMLTLLYQTEDTYGLSGGELYYDNGILAFQVEAKHKSLEDAGFTAQEYFEALTNNPDFVLAWDTLFDMSYPVITYNVGTGETGSVDIKGADGTADYIAGIWDGNFVIPNSELYLQDIESGEKSRWLDLDGIRFYTAYQCSDFLLVEAAPEEGYAHEYYICLYGETVLHPLKVPYEANIMVTYESDTMVYLTLYPQKSESTESEFEYRLIRKTELLEWIND